MPFEDLSKLLTCLRSGTNKVKYTPINISTVIICGIHLIGPKLHIFFWYEQSHDRLAMSLLMCPWQLQVHNHHPTSQLICPSALQLNSPLILTLLTKHPQIHWFWGLNFYGLMGMLAPFLHKEFIYILFLWYCSKYISVASDLLWSWLLVQYLIHP